MLEAELAVLDPEDDPVEDGLTLEVGAGAAKTQALSTKFVEINGFRKLTSTGHNAESLTLREDL